MDQAPTTARRLQTDPVRTHEVRRRVLQQQLDRLTARAGVGTAPGDRDALARSRRLATRLEHDQLDW